MPENKLYYGDNLEVLRRYIKDESVDLVYLDPPFNSNVDYNILFKERDGAEAASQIKAFKDTWNWDIEAAEAYEQLLQGVYPYRLKQLMVGLRGFMGTTDMLAYLAMMAIRLQELRRALKPTGSLYLHCDPNASHYLKLVLDATFGPENFCNEIVWRRTGAHNKGKRFAPIHDTLLFYSKSATSKWNRPKRPFMLGHVKENFVHEKGVWRTNYYGNVLTGSGTRNGLSGKPWRGFNPTAKGRHWAIPGGLLEDIDNDLSELNVLEKLEWLFKRGHITITPGEAWPMYQRTIDPETDGQLMSDVWAFQPYTDGLVFGTNEGIDADVKWLSPRDRERLGYPTQKPQGLLERVLLASSEEGDVVLDPFCGCGTTVAAAQNLKRKWIGIDITSLAISLIKVRLRDSFGIEEKKDYEVLGEPVSVPDAEELAKTNPYQFQWWALGKAGARPFEQKKGSDKGIDGRLYFHDEGESGETKSIIFSVKAGKTGVEHVRDLRGVIDRERAAIGVLISMQEPTQPMRTEVASAGFYESKGWGKKYPRMQLITVAELLAGKQVDYPPARGTNVTFKKAPKAKAKGQRKRKLNFGGTEEY